MTIKIAVLKTQQQVIADFKEIMSGEEPVAYLFKEPHVVDFNQFSFAREELSFGISFEMTVLRPISLASNVSDFLFD